MKRRAIVLAALAACCMAALLLIAGCSCSAQSSQSASASSESASASSASASSASSEASDMSKEVSDKAEPAKAAPTGVRYILVIGDDSWEGRDPHADMMCLLRVDLDNKVMHEITVPRDTKYDYGGFYDKLNQVLTHYGAKAQTDAAASIVGVPIDYYVKVNFDGLMSIVEHFGGLEANLPYPITYSFYTHDYPDESYSAGPQTLTPWRTMAISRARTGYGGNQEMIRQFVDRQMLATLIQYAYRGGVDQIEPLFTTLQPFIETNIPLEDQVDWARTLGSKGSFEIIGTTGPYGGDFDAEANGQWLVNPDPNGWANLMAAVESYGDVWSATNTYIYNAFTDATPNATVTQVTVG